MEHDFIDKYAYLDSPVHKMDARAKLVSATVLILGVVLTSRGNYFEFVWAALLVMGITLFSRVPFRYIIMRSLVVIPFVALAGVFIVFNAPTRTAGFETLIYITLKATLSASIAVLLTSITPMPELLKGMERLGAPKLLTTVTSFLYRYFFVMIDEFERMNRARISRSTGSGHWKTLKGMAQVLASGLLRSFERGERTYLAMLSRGFDGSVRTLNEDSGSKARDFIIAAAFIGLVIILKSSRWLIGS